VSKWANDKHAGFETIYQLLLRRAHESQPGELLYHGNYDPRWTPE
jgi:hypothetical protein